MKYLMLIYGNQKKWASIPAEEWPEAIARQDAFNRKYQETGELIGAYGLADAAPARLVRREGGVPAVTDGPYLETKEYIASFYLLDCESEERALQIAADMPVGGRRSRWSSGRSCTRPSRTCDRTGRDVEDLLRELAPQVLAALVRRYGQFHLCEDASQEALLAAALQWPADGPAGEPARLADHGRLAAADGPGPQRAVAAEPGGPDRGGHPAVRTARCRRPTRTPAGP